MPFRNAAFLRKSRSSGGLLISTIFIIDFNFGFWSIEEEEVRIVRMFLGISTLRPFCRRR